MLGPRSDGPHRLTRIPRSTALVEMAADNVPWHEATRSRRAAQTFDVLARALSGAETFRLNAGPDLGSLPALFLDALKGSGRAAS
jgi:hypothetical protein